MNNSLKELIAIQFKEYWREPEVLFWTLAFPIIMAWVLGITFLSKPVMNYKVAYVEASADQELPQKLYKRFFPEDKIQIQIPGRTYVENIVIAPMSESEAMESLKNGTISIIIRPHEDHLVYSFDSANEEAVKIYLWIEKKVFGKKSKNITEAVKGKGNRYIDYLIPGLIALGIMNATIWGVGWTLIEFRIKKFMRRMLATPMKKFEFMASLSITRLVLGVIEASILYTFVHFVFDIRIEGSLLAVILMFIAGHIAFNGLAVFLASRTASSRAGNTIINVVTLPFFLLSGVFFSYRNFPDWMVSFVEVLPLTVLADTMRTLFLTPVGVSAIIIPFCYLTAVGAFFYMIGIRIYKWY
ncbi:MAG: ABC transporter permease [Leptospirales bacterium]